MIKHERPIEFVNGMVDPNALLEFMGGCHCEDLESPLPRGSHFEEGHHLIFPKKKVKKYPHKVVSRLKNSKYNIIQMLKFQEDYYHQTVQAEVPLDEIDTDAAEEFMQEADVLTSFAASSLLRIELQSQVDKARERSEKADPRLIGRLMLVKEMYQDQLEKVERITVISHSIVTGALVNYYLQRPEPGLQVLIEQRLEADQRVLQTQIYSPIALMNVGYTNLQGYVHSAPLEIRDTILMPQAQAA